MFKKLKFYKKLLIEIVETLCTICLYLELEGSRNHNQYSRYMQGHFKELKMFSEVMRKEKYKEWNNEI